MWRGLYTGAAGMMTQERRTAVIANNLANANTTGYKRDRAIDAEFEPMLEAADALFKVLLNEMARENTPKGTLNIKINAEYEIVAGKTAKRSICRN